MNKRDDDLELEIVNLDKEDNLAVEIFDLDEDNYPEHKAASIPARQPLLAPRFTLRQRHTQLVVTIGIVGVLLSILLSSYTPVRNRLVEAIIPSSTAPTVHIGPDIEQFYFDANPTWGQLFVDGKRVMHLPRSANSDEPPLRLPHGRHVIRWIAAPFMPLQCMVSVPFNTSIDTCHFDQFTIYPKGTGTWFFSFPLSLAQLPQPAFSNLVLAVQSALDMYAPTETVMPGEVYAVNTTRESMLRTKKPLKAILHYQLDVENNLDGVCSTLFEESTACTFNGQECYLFCTVPTMLNEFRTNASWDVFAAVQASWEYKTIDGSTLAQNQPELLGTTTVYDHLLPLRITWDGTHWHVALLAEQLSPGAQQQFDIPCNTALNAVRDVLVPSSSEQAHSGINWQYIPSTNSATGCLGIATLDQGLRTSSPAIAYCLHRFGVFLAANSVAHAYWPGMPVADAYEQQLAQKLAASRNVDDSDES